MFKIKNSFNLFFAFLVLVLSLDCAANYYYQTKKTVTPAMSINNYSNQGLTIGSGGTLGVFGQSNTPNGLSGLLINVNGTQVEQEIFNAVGFYSAFTPQGFSGKIYSLELSSPNLVSSAFIFGIKIYSDSTVLFSDTSGVYDTNSYYLTMPIYPIKNMRMTITPLSSNGGILQAKFIASKMVP